jgi:NADPH:quinone reductase
VNAAIDLGVVATGGVLAVYANDGGTALDLTIQDAMWLNLQIGFVILYTLGPDERAAAVRAVCRVLEAQAVGIGPESGLPVHTRPLEHAAAAHAAVEHAVVGKQLLSVAEL